MIQKSRFYSMKKPKVEVPTVVNPALTEVEIDSLLSVVEEATQVIKDATAPIHIHTPSPEPEIKVDKVVTLDNKKAYNVWQDPDSKMYMLDVFEYNEDKVFKFERKEISLSSPMALYEIRKIFTNKIVLKKKGM